MPLEDCEIVYLARFSDRWGDSTFTEGGYRVTFDTERVYYPYDIQGGNRPGGHAHERLTQLELAVKLKYLDRWNQARRRIGSRHLSEQSETRAA